MHTGRLDIWGSIKVSTNEIPEQNMMGAMTMGEVSTVFQGT